MTQDVPKTADDWTAAQKLAEAQAAAADAETRLIASKKTLAAAQQGDADAAKLAAAQQAAAIAAAQQKQAEAQAAIAKSRFTIPDSGYKGEITAGSKAGEVEASLLAAKAVNTAAANLCDKLAVLNSGDTVVLYGMGDLPNFQALVSYNAQREILDLALTDALKTVNVFAVFPVPKVLGPEVSGRGFGFISLEDVGAGLDAANKLLGFFRSDYGVQGVDVKLDGILLTNAVAARLINTNQVKVQMPAVYTFPGKTGQSAILKDLEALASKKEKLRQAIAAADKVSDELTAQAASEADVIKKKFALEQVAVRKEASDKAQTAIALYDAFFTKLTATDDKSAFPMATVLRQDAVSALLANGARLMAVKLYVCGGSFYTKKNMLTFFGGMPFSSMGGVVVTYTLFDGKSGDLLASGTIPIEGGYVKSSKLQKKLAEE